MKLQVQSCIITFLLILGACTAKPKNTQYFGQVEMAEIDVASRITSRVKAIKVQRGQLVDLNELLLTMDDDLIAVRKDRARAGLEAASQQQKILDHAVRDEELLQLEVAKEAAKKQLEFAELTLQRLQVLLVEGAIAQQQFDEAKLQAHAAKAKYRAAQAAFQLGRNGARSEQRNAAKAQVQQAETGVAELEAYEKDLHLTAPVTGEVVEIYVRQGELVTQGYPVLTLMQRDDVWFSFFVREDSLHLLQQGKSYHVRIPALRDTTVLAKLQYLKPLPAFANHLVSSERGRIDLKTFEIRLLPENMPEGLRPGMTAVLEVEGQ